jgi:hypothetical protein
MSDERDRSRSTAEHFSSPTTIGDEEGPVVDCTGPRWELVDHQPERKRPVHGVDPYNTVGKQPRMQAWSRIEKR